MVHSHSGSRSEINRKSSSRGWSEENEAFAVAVSNKHAALVWICNRSAERSEKRQKIMGVIIASGLYLFGASGIPTVLSNTDENSTNEIILILLGVMAIFFGLLKTVNVALQEDKIIGKNRWASGMHAELTLEIRKEIEKKRKHRILWRKFYKKIGEKEIELQTNSPTASKSILKAYYNKFGDTALRERILFGDLYDLENARRVTVTKAPKNARLSKAVKKQRKRKQELRDATTSAESSNDIDTDTDTGKSEKSEKSENSGSVCVVPSSSYSSEHLEPSPKMSPKKRRSLKKSRTSIESRGAAALAARNDLRDRYELERYYMH
jgi:hypothetical protein